MTPLQLLAGAQVTGRVGNPEMDPLVEWDVLAGARLGECTFDAVNMRAGVLLDLREASQLRLANTGLLVMRQVEVLDWVGQPNSSGGRGWTVTGSLPTLEDDRFNVRLYLAPNARLTISGRSVEFVAGDVPSLDADGMASMSSELTPTQLTAIGPFHPK